MVLSAVVLCSPALQKMAIISWLQASQNDPRCAAAAAEAVSALLPLLAQWTARARGPAGGLPPPPGELLTEQRLAGVQHAPETWWKTSVKGGALQNWFSTVVGAEGALCSASGRHCRDPMLAPESAALNCLCGLQG